MTTNFAEHVVTRSELPHRRSLEPTIRAVCRDVLRKADHACCCSARPAVVAVMPSAPGRPYATDLLLCGHHYRASRAGLAAAGATIFDRDGMSVSPEAAALVNAR
jgi:hypothetical protein